MVIFDGSEHRVAGMSGTSVRLAGADGTPAVVLLSHLVSSDGFTIIGGERPLAATASVMALEDVPAGAAAAARDWERHIVEVETGLPPGAPSGASPKAEYDPATTTLRQRQPRPRPASAEARARPARSQLQLQDRYNYRVRQDTCGNLPCHYPKGYHHAPSAYYWQSACLRSHGNRQPGHSLMAAATRPNVPGAGLQGRSRGPACYSPRAEPLTASPVNAEPCSRLMKAAPDDWRTAQVRPSRR
jgi:hypothetical protein